jgi:hypothetical protein
LAQFIVPRHARLNEASGSALGGVFLKDDRKLGVVEKSSRRVQLSAWQHKSFGFSNADVI